MDELNFLTGLNEVETTGSTIAKEQILRSLIEGYEHGEEFFRLAFNNTVYGIAEKTFYNAFDEEADDSHEHVSDWLYDYCKEHTVDAGSFNVLQQKADRIASLSGDLQKGYIMDFFIFLGPLRAKWYSRVLLHDLRCGVQVKTINSVFRALRIPLIEKFALQLAKKLDPYDEQDVKKNITFPCAMECKYDGYRIQAEIFPEGKVVLMSRRGNDRTVDYPEVVSELKRLFANQHVLLDGEMVADSFQKLTRKDDKSVRKYVIFDLLVDEKLPYSSRWDNLVSLTNDLGITDYLSYQKYIINKPEITSADQNLIFRSEHFSADNIEDMQKYFDDINIRGEEGIIVKLFNRPYERGSRRHMFKCKKVYTADLKIIGYKTGEGKRTGKVATLELIDASGTIRVDVGSGIDDDTCEILTQQINDAFQSGGTPETDSFIGQICEILYNEKTETGSLRHPRFIKIRDDKEEADDLS